jgi:hypothetical protein
VSWRGWLCVALALTACPNARIPRIPGDPPPAVLDAEAEREYQKVLERYTSAKGVFDNLDTKVFFQVTWLSPVFADARVHREGMFKAVPATELEKRLADERARLNGVTEFFFGVHANDYKFEDFGQPHTMWRMVLVIGDEEIPPISVERLGRTNVEMRSYFSYMENFWVGYQVRFPARPLAPGQKFHLKMASALGQAELPYTAD